MRIILVVTLSLFCFACGDDAPPVGTGDPLSSLSAEPTGLEMYNSIRSGITTSSGVIFFKNQTSIYQQIGLPTPGESQVSDCTGGGKISQNSSVQASNGGGTFSVESSFDNCKVVLILGGNSYTETIQGSTTLNTTVNGNSYDSSTSWSLTISGDLGLSAACSLSGKSDGTNTTTSGQCDFLDSEGTRITLNGTSL